MKTNIMQPIAKKNTENQELRRVPNKPLSLGQFTEFTKTAWAVCWEKERSAEPSSRLPPRHD